MSDESSGHARLLFSMIGLTSRETRGISHMLRDDRLWRQMDASTARNNSGRRSVTTRTDP
ncbi:hypothetical protein AB4Y40_14410 [Paraburkholderia sp. EG287B]|uniref:hypothetical protein n=1 Tax=Paraburkholderia sp. EG287B TaxID=3237010 RepID=UPI0034D2092B